MRRIWMLAATLAAGACADHGSRRVREPSALDGGDVSLADAALRDGASPLSTVDGSAVIADSGKLDATSSLEAGPALEAGSVRLPPDNAGFDYQIGGAYAPPGSVRIVSRDRAAAPAAGLYNICYVNGFQAQPGEADFWLQEQPDLVLRQANGEPVIDPDWDEMLLDISTDAKRTRLTQIVGGWIEQCARDGFDAVEIDNLDTFDRSGGRISRSNAIAFVRLLADVAHAAGLAIAQKNAAELVASKAAMGTDFVVAEECNQWQECDVYRDAYGDKVLVIEYQRSAFEAGCAAFPGLSIVLRNLSVSPPGQGGYVFDGC